MDGLENYEDFYSKCTSETLANLLNCWRDTLSSEKLRTIKDILEERGEVIDCSS